MGPSHHRVYKWEEAQTAIGTIAFGGAGINKMKEKIMILALVSLFGCANSKFLYSKEVPMVCTESSKLKGATSIVRFSFTKYKNCLGHRNLLIARWTPPDKTFVNTAMHNFLEEYLNVMKVKKVFLSKELHNQEYYLIYKLEKTK